MTSRIVFATVFAFAVAAIGQDLSNLPTGITQEQALELARSNKPSTPVSTSRFQGSNVQDRAGAVDENEGLIPSDSVRSRRQGKDSLHPPPPKPTLVRFGRRLFQDADPSMFASHVGAVGSGYALGPGDEVVLTLWGQKEARYQLVLDREGQVNVEGVGIVSLTGQTVGQASDILKKRLQRIYSGLGSGATSMDLTVGKLKQIRVFVVGDVVQQGGYLLSGNTSILAALYQAKGPTDLGSEREIEVVRGKNKVKVDLYDYFFRGTRPVGDILQDGDIVRIPRHGALVQIKGDVGRPATYELKSGEGARELLEYAGGANSTAASTPMTVQRVFENGRVDALTISSPQKIQEGSNQPLVDGDVVQVFRGSDPSEKTAVILGEVRFPGSYPLTGSPNAADLIRMAGGPTKAAYTHRVLLSRKLNDGSKEQLRFSVESAASIVPAAQDTIQVYDLVTIHTIDSVRVSGAVRKPGTYPWLSGMTIKDLVLKAGGFRWQAETSKLRLETPIAGSRDSRIDILALDSSLNSSSADREIPARAHLAVPFDPQSDSLQLVHVGGRVMREGQFSLLFSGERLSSLWTRIGGVKTDAYLAGARLYRGDSAGRIQIDFEKAMKDIGGYDDLPLRGGDSIFVPARPATVVVRGRVNSPSNIVWREGKSWRWYIQQAGGFSDSADEARVYVRYADGTVQTRDNGIDDPPNAGSEIIVPFRKPPEPTTMKDFLGGMNLVLGTAIAGLTLFVLLQQNK